jgi:hypothetical protein
MNEDDPYHIRETLPERSYDLYEILPQIEEELDARLGTKPSPKDRLAIRAALVKAAVRGFQRGMAVEAAAVTELLESDLSNALERVDTEFPDFGAEVDLWAEEYPDSSK